MVRLALAVAALVVAAPAAAATLDPACQQNAADPSVVYDASGGARFCPPVVDEAGRSLPDDALTRCVAKFDTVETEVLNPAPGAVVALAPPPGVAWGGRLSVWCETAAGAGEAVSVDARFPAARPGRPHLLP